MAAIEIPAASKRTRGRAAKTYYALMVRRLKTVNQCRYLLSAIPGTHNSAMRHSIRAEVERLRQCLGALDERLARAPHRPTADIQADLAARQAAVDRLCKGVYAGVGPIPAADWGYGDESGYDRFWSAGARVAKIRKINEYEIAALQAELARAEAGNEARNETGAEIAPA